MKLNSRAAAIRIVARWLQTGAFPGRLLEAVADDRAFVTELVYGAVRWRRQLEWLVGQYAPRIPAPEISAALYVGLYQILHLADVAEYAAVNETVAAVRDGDSAGAAGFVNAVLRRTLRERPALRERLARQPPGIRLSHPDCLLQRWGAYFSPARAEQIAAWNNQRAEVAVTANNLKITGQSLQSALQEHGLIARISESAGKTFFTVKRGVSVPALPGYAQGWFLAADPASARAVNRLGAQPGMRVLDACAAPGGKTALLAGDMEGQGQLVAWEPQAERRERMAANMERLGLADFVALQPVNALHPPADIGQFDRILLDAPCSNTGVIRHKPDVRWHFNPRRLDVIIRLQTALLTRLAGLLAPGGRLVYSTCSLEPEENGGLVREWLARHSGYELLGECQGVPPESGTDGFYAACLNRRGAAGAEKVDGGSRFRG